MRPLVLRRLPAGLAAMALVSAWAMPAQAAPSAAAKVDFYVKSYTVTPGPGTSIATRLFADRTLALAGDAVSLRYQFIDQDPAFRFSPQSAGDNCRTVTPGNVDLSCSPPVTALTPAGADSGQSGAIIRIAADAAPGLQATLTATMTVKGYAPVTRTARITVGEGVTLTSVTGDRFVRAAPGASVNGPLEIRNTGSVAAQGVGFRAGRAYFLESRTQYSNCDYVDGRLAWCTFDQALEPGTTYRVNLPFRVRADTPAPGLEASTFEWMTDEELADEQQWQRNAGYGPTGTPGRGGVLRLTPVATAKAGPPQALTGNPQHALKFTITGRNSADLAAVGATVSGPEGAVVTVPVGLLNHGPATFDDSSNTGVPKTRFFVPKGSTAVRVPDRCYPMSADGTDDWARPGAPGAPRYKCYSSALLKPGGTVKFEFGLRVDQVIPGARGAVTFVVEAEAGELNPANNTAAVVINPAAAPAPGDGGGEGGGEGGLPITGPQGALFGAIGLLLVLAGAGALVLTRRRAA
ncbi:hypothetical protein Aab01nite_73460 [Paractinoplanes abujensis]|uniref:Gram-positive cocci surface proteins LPxTG domain-containing protein n=1 Tax=Paractinoplanes abujensis TaxID=882441 RepID=A0A7W7CUP5_9ACTN|nr:hypothetical protein [Actinoplanes abujensis]MBB4695024.1 hypothetical protein [Actinoplanes abujensis]GID23756.1 hypothetical protein Aab01nite_73460 [Actinoplanes abujensis]